LVFYSSSIGNAYSRSTKFGECHGQHLYWECQLLNVFSVKKNMEHINTPQGKTADFLNVKAGGVPKDPCGLKA